MHSLPPLSQSNPKSVKPFGPPLSMPCLPYVFHGKHLLRMLESLLAPSR